MECNIPQRHDGLTGQTGQTSSARINLEKTSYRQQAKRARAAMSMAERMRQSETVCGKLLELPEVEAANVVACYLAHGNELDLGEFMQALTGGDNKFEETTEASNVALILGELAAHQNPGEHEPSDGNSKTPIKSEASHVPIAPKATDISQNPARAVALPVTLRGSRLVFVQVDAIELAKPEALPHCLREPSHPLSAVPEELMDRIVNPTDIDVVILPGLAFDTHGTRLGYGGGYYDAWLAEAYGLGDTEEAGAAHEQAHATGRLATDQAGPALYRRPFLIGTCFDCQLLPPATTLPREPHDIAMDAVVTTSKVVRA